MSKQDYSVSFTRRSEATDLGLDLLPYQAAQVALHSPLGRQGAAGRCDSCNLFPVLSTTFISGRASPDREVCLYCNAPSPHCCSRPVGTTAQPPLLPTSHGSTTRPGCHLQPSCGRPTQGEQTRRPGWQQPSAGLQAQAGKAALARLRQGKVVVTRSERRCVSLVSLRAGWKQTQSDIRDYTSLYKVCEGVDCIFHTASYGMSGPEQLRKEQVESVNVGGTNNVINVCKERSIPRLVYTSTINVVFAGKPIEDGDEASVLYVPPDVHIDHYSRTKAIAEQMVLSANGCSLKGGELLRTCVLRPCGIYGPEEEASSQE
ncbi:putative short-chain dehydrogenase/reductase family 42E member 2 [Lates japonicus]|uniref:Short-chain dehydrogenase/reductase family 42E member 2 n=1 Tax=Lates japonicus TaxID=270547 RepID=A0AAD3N224_LATJO|nr:putative short-chain dehydrogenase/reductase family 42E member 2 [Lates japonicus]